MKAGRYAAPMPKRKKKKKKKKAKKKPAGVLKKDGTLDRRYKLKVGRPKIAHKRPPGRPKLSADHKRNWSNIGYAKAEQIKLLYTREKHKYKSKTDFMDMMSDMFNVSWETIYKIVRGDTYWNGGNVGDLEAAFKHKVLKFLKKLGHTWYVKNDHRALRGIPDVIACINGNFVALELKGSREKLYSNSNKSTKLQLFQLNQIVGRATGIGLMVYPENWGDVQERLKLIAKGDRNDIAKCRKYSQERLYYWSSKIKGQLGFSPKSGVPHREDRKQDRDGAEGSADDVQQDGVEACEDEG